MTPTTPWETLRGLNWQGELDIHAQDSDGNTPLLFALSNTPRHVRWFLEQGSSPNHVNHKGVGALDIAMVYAGGAYENLPELLVEFGANVHLTIERLGGPLMTLPSTVENNTERLIWATLREPGLIPLVLQKPCNVNAMTPMGCCVLNLALSSMKVTTSAINALLDQGVDMTLAEQDSIQPLHRLTEKLFFNLDVAKAAQKLIDCGASINSQNHEGETVLNHFHLFTCTPLELAKVLLENGADPNLSNHKDETPLMKAIHAQNLDLAKLLLEHGADFSHPNTQESFAWAIKEKSEFAALLEREKLEFQLRKVRQEDKKGMKNRI